MSKGLSNPRFQMSESGIWTRDPKDSDCLRNPRPQQYRKAMIHGGTANFASVVAGELEAIGDKWTAAEVRENATELAMEMLSSVVSITTDMFGEDVKVYESADPEFPEDRHMVFAVECKMPVAKLIETEMAWIERVSAIAPNFGNIRLSITPLE